MLTAPRSPPKFRHYSSEGGSIPQRPHKRYQTTLEEELYDVGVPQLHQEGRGGSMEASNYNLTQQSRRAGLDGDQDQLEDGNSVDRQTVYHPEDVAMPRGDKPKGPMEKFLFACCGIRPAMSVLVAMDSFKGSLTSREAALVVEAALHSSRIDRVYTLPLSDGGEGYLDAFKAIHGDSFEILRLPGARGPLGEILSGDLPVMYDMNNSVAAVESALACGFTLVPTGMLDPHKATSYGVGQMILHAAEAGARTIYVGVGGTAAVDGGVGMAMAMGCRFHDAEGNELMAGDSNVMPRVANIVLMDRESPLNNIKVIIGADVQNALLGAEGAVTIYGPQKGVQEADIPLLDHQMQKYASLLETVTNKPGLSRQPGSGAGGGIAFTLAALLQGVITSGFATIAEGADLPARVKEADLVITGEGTFDASSLYGKLPIEVGRLCKAAGTTCFLYTGRSSQDVLERPEDGISCIIPLLDSRASEEEIRKAKENAKELLFNSVTRSLKLLRLGKDVRI